MSLARIIGIGVVSLSVLAVSPLEASLIPKSGYEASGSNIPAQGKRYIALNMISEGVSRLQKGKYYDAYKQLTGGIKLLDEFREPFGDFDYAEANYWLGRWYFHATQSNQNLSPEARSRLLNSTISYFGDSIKEFERVRRDPSQFSNVKLHNRLFDLDRYMTDAYFALGDFKTSSDYIIKVIQKYPNEHYLGVLAKISSRLTGKEIFELMQKIYLLFDRNLADRIIEKITGSQSDLAVGTSDTQNK